MTDLISIQLKGVLENAIFNKIISLNTGVSNTVLRAIVSRVAEQAAVGVVGSVNTGANFQLNTIPQNLLGVKNPVNITTANQNSNNITNNLSNILDVQITSQVTDRIVSSLERELKGVLPADRLNIINFSALAATLVQTITPVVSGSVGTALKSFTDGLFSRGTTTQPIIPGFDDLFSKIGNSDQALDQIGENYALLNASRYLQQSKNFNVNNEQNNEKLTVLKQGFTDPNANYPTKEYSGKPDTNRLATGDAAGTIVQKKNLERMLGAKLPGGEAWDEPPSAYKAEYPYNKVTQTETGHVIEVDDTAGAERLHLYHAAGTYIEIDSNGSMVRRIKGSSYEIIDRNGKISISGKADISVNGACNIFVGNDANIEVEGDTNITCYNDITAQAAGNVNISASNTLNLTGSNVNVQAYNEMNVTSNVSLKVHATEDIFLLSNVDTYVQATNLYTKTSESTFNQTGEDFHIKTGSNFNADTGGQAHINSGNAADSKDSKLAGISEIGILSSRKDITSINLNDPSPLTLADSFTLENEEEQQDQKEVKAHRDKLLTTGVASAEELDRTPIEQESTQVTCSQSVTIPGTESLKKVTALPGNYNLSPNFTLEMLTTKAALTKDQIETSELTYGEIVFNLQQVALNVLEPAYNLYPNMIITSGYRQRAKSSKASQHPLGCAVDLQFKGVSKEDYFEIAKRLAKAVRYDQLLLEYSAYTNNPWIHISYTGKVDKLQCLTFWNHKVHAKGLVQLA